MTDAAAIQGDYVDLRFVKSRKVCQIVVEVPIEAGPEVVQAFGTPRPDTSVPVALARLQAQSEPTKERRKFEDLKRSQQAGMLCQEQRFRAFLKEEKGFAIRFPAQTDEDQAATFVRQHCNVNTRSAFDTNDQAAAKWDTLYSEYVQWQRT